MSEQEGGVAASRGVASRLSFGVSHRMSMGAPPPRPSLGGAGHALVRRSPSGGKSRQSMGPMCSMAGGPRRLSPGGVKRTLPRTALLSEEDAAATAEPTSSCPESPPHLSEGGADRFLNKAFAQLQLEEEDGEDEQETAKAAADESMMVQREPGRCKRGTGM